jgi:tetratricopeptide (TPR) repeat protein
LIEAIVYNTVLRAQRKVLHRHTAIALEAQWQGSESDHAEDLAYHYGKAEEYDKTLHYLLLAGERAAARYANDTAVAHFEQAMSILASVQRASDELRWRIISGLGEVYQFIGNYDASLSALQSGLELAHSPQLSPEQRAGLYRRLAETASKKGDQAQAIAYLQDALETLGEIQDPLSQAEAARIYARLSWSFFRQAELEPARQAALQAEIYARYANNLNALAMAQNYLGGIYYRQGDLQQALQHTRAAMTCWQEIGYTWGAAVVLSNLGILEVVAGNWSAGFEAFERVLKMRQDMGDIEGVAITHNNLGSLACDRGSLDVAEGHMRNSLAISIPFQMSWQTANSSSGLAEILLYQGRLQGALESLEQARGMASEINARDVLADLGPIEAEICLAMGDLVKAERTAREAAQMASEIGSNPLVAAAWRAAAASLLRQGQPHAAHQALDQAWQALEQADDELETGRTHAQAVRIFQALDDQTQAETHRRIALSIFHRLGAARDLSLLQSQAS